ncbi:MAG: hypothetical protein IT292_09465 [Deltaproteobacteria bacterium]|nr:hypothetical protein [Deltaproteobacteria bacterium]
MLEADLPKLYGDVAWVVYEWHRTSFNDAGKVVDEIILSGTEATSYKTTNNDVSTNGWKGFYLKIIATNAGGSTELTSLEITVANPTSGVDTAAPRAYFLGKKCSAKVCSEAVLVTDADPSQGIKVFNAIVRTSPLKPTANSVGVKPLNIQSERMTDDIHIIKLRRQKNTHYRLSIKATDNAGNVQKKYLVVKWTITK